MKYSIYCLIAIGCLSLFSSCEGDDDSSMPLIYEVCDMTLTFTENDKSNITSLSVDQIPQSIRTYVAGNFAGFGIKSASSFETEAKDYFEIIASNNGKLLFDNEGSFLCGDDSFSTGVYEEEEEEYEENEDINPEDLPQSI